MEILEFALFAAVGLAAIYGIGVVFALVATAAKRAGLGAAAQFILAAVVTALLACALPFWLWSPAGGNLGVTPWWVVWGGLAVLGVLGAAYPKRFSLQ